MSIDEFNLVSERGADHPVLPVAGKNIAISMPDLARYRRHIAHLTLPDERESAMIAALWQVMQSFVDRAFGDDAAQLARKAGDESYAEREKHEAPMIASQAIHTKTHDDLSEASPDSATFGGRER